MNGYALDLREPARAAMPRVPEAPHLREAAIATWRGRMINEHASSNVFAALAEQMRDAGMPEEWVGECARFAEEERTHGVLCGAVVEALGGEALAEVPARADLPAHRDVDPREAALRNVLSVACLSETVAVALIGAERLEMPEGELRELLTRIWADEVGHARFGWTLAARVLPTLDDTARARLATYLRVAFGHLEQHELAHLPLSSRPPPEGAQLGLCSGADARALFLDTVGEVIVPGLARLGLDAARAWAERVPPSPPAAA